MYVDVSSDGINNPSNYGYYTFDVLDYTSGKGNYTYTYYNDSAMGVPNIGDFLTERKVVLPVFSTYTISGMIEYNSVLQSIYNPYNSNYFARSKLENGCASPNYYNINTSNVGSGGSFTQSYITSCGT